MHCTLRAEESKQIFHDESLLECLCAGTLPCETLGVVHWMGDAQSETGQPPFHFARGGPSAVHRAQLDEVFRRPHLSLAANPSRSISRILKSSSACITIGTIRLPVIRKTAPRTNPTTAVPTAALTP